MAAPFVWTRQEREDVPGEVSAPAHEAEDSVDLEEEVGVATPEVRPGVCLFCLVILVIHSL